MPNGALTGEFLDTIGVEMEGEGLDRRVVHQKLLDVFSRLYSKPIVNVIRDASSESLIGFVGTENTRDSLKIYSHNKLYQHLLRQYSGELIPFGYEIVVNPISMTELSKVINIITMSLEKLGDFTTERSSVHFHIGFAHNLRLMKKLLMVCMAIDPLLFRLGGMGRAFRGNSNLAAYCRPLLNSSAVRIRNSRSRTFSVEERTNFQTSLREEALDIIMERADNDNDDEITDLQIEDVIEEILQNRGNDDDIEVGENFAKIINPLKALESITTSSWWECFGVFPEILGLPKFHPARYTSCNFYSIPMHGTIEFRHFNQSLDPLLIVAVGKLLRATVEMSTTLKKDDLINFPVADSNRQINMTEVDNLLGLLMGYFRRFELENIPSDDEIRILMDTIEKSTFDSLPDIPPLTHLREFAMDEQHAYNLIKVSKVLEPRNIDTHTIEFSTILGG
jgi:hypothetical protein